MGWIPGAPVRRADHIGSLLRPRTLKDAYNAYRAGTLDAAEFEAVRAQAIRNVVALQEGTGLEVVTDGDFRRQSWLAGFVDAVAGLTNKPTYFNFTDDHGIDVPTKVPYVTGKLARTRGVTTEEFESLRTITTRIPKITLPAPSVIQFFRGKDGISPDVYPDIDYFWADLVQIYREEVAELAARGCPYIQLDEVPVALLCDPTIRERVASWGWDPDELVGTYINATNAALESRPESMAVGMHLCRGNFRGHWIGAGGYDAVAERLFNDAKVNVFLLEYDNARSGGFEPLRFVPNHKAVVLGLISSKTAALESAAELTKRIEAASKYIPLDRLGLSPQCGFGTTVGGAPMTEDDQKRKLELVVQVAGDVWRS